MGFGCEGLFTWIGTFSATVLIKSVKIRANEVWTDKRSSKGLKILKSRLLNIYYTLLPEIDSNFTGSAAQTCSFNNK